MKKSLVAVLALVIAFSIIVPAFAEDAKLKKIIVSPNDMDIEIWVDQSDQSYDVGDDIKVFFRTNRDGFVTLFDISPDGDVTMLFPEDRYGDNFVASGRTYELPTAGKRYTVEGPAGTEVLYGVASIYYTQFHRNFDGRWDARELHTRVLDSLKEYPRSRWDIAKTEFEVRDSYNTIRRLKVRAIESDVSVYLDGKYAGKADITLELTPGTHQIVAMKEGYRVSIKDVSAEQDFYYSTWTPQLDKLPMQKTGSSGSGSSSSGNNNWLDWLNIEFKLNL